MSPWVQHARLPCPSPAPRACSNSCPLSQWRHPTISSSVTHFSCPQSFPVSGSFPVSWLFASGGRSIRASASVLPVNIQGGFPLALTRWILQSKGLSRVFSSTTAWKYLLFRCSAFFMVQLSHPYMTAGKTIRKLRVVSKKKLYGITLAYCLSYIDGRWSF